jgi:hypothetical protein
MLIFIAFNNLYAEDGSLTGKSDFRFRYRQSDRLEVGFEEDFPHLHDYLEQVERLNLLYTKDVHTFGLQIDEVMLGLNRYSLDGNIKRSWDLTNGTLLQPFDDMYVVPEKVFYSFEDNGLRLELGDFYASFGRGIALNVIKNTSVDIDTSLRGSKLSFSKGDWEGSILTGVTNRQQVSRDNPNLSLYRDAIHSISGAQLTYYGFGVVQLSTHASMASFGEQIDEPTPDMFLRLKESNNRYQQLFMEGPDVTVVGITSDIYGFLGSDIFVEGDLFSYSDDALQRQTLDKSSDMGHLIYGSISTYPLGAVLLIEGKWSKNAEVVNSYNAIDTWEWSTPPSLEYERMITEDASAAVNSNDIVGGKVRLDVPIQPNVLTPYISCSTLYDKDLVGLHFNKVPEIVVHPVMGVQYFPSQAIVLTNIGFRRDIRVQESEYNIELQEFEQYDQLVHVDGEIAFPLPNGDLMEFNYSGWKFWWGDDQHNDFLTTQNALVYKHNLDSRHLDFILYQDWTNNTQLLSTGNINENLYGAFEIVYSNKKQHIFKALYGAYKAGIRCSGGQCRTLPGFEGLQISYSAPLAKLSSTEN